MPYAALSSRAPDATAISGRFRALRGALNYRCPTGFLVGVTATVRTRSISTATALAVLFSSAALSVVAAGTASAATATVTSPGGIVANGTRVFVGDSSAGRIVAANYSGSLVDSVSGIGQV